MAENKFSREIQQVRADMKALKTDIIDLEKQSLASSANIRRGFTGAFPTTGGDFKKLITDVNTALANQNAILEKLTNSTQKYNTQKKALNTLTGQEKVNNRELAKNADLQVQSTSKLVGAYGNLIAKRKQAKKTLQDLIVSEKASNREINKAQRAYDKYTAKINKANRATSNFAKTSLGGMVRGFRNLFGAFGIIGGATLIATLTTDIFNLVKQLESLNFALKTVTGSQEEFVRVQAFLLDISKRYGTELIATTERYTKFLAAAKQSNLGLADTEKIFESVTKASGVLGLSTEELTGVYLALEQMLSKGKVTTEELRRQLGERLPGAFGIMAEALGVSVQKLDEMLKKGEILSSEALPKFAEQLQKAYGIEAIETVDTLVAAQNRLTTAWIEFVTSVESNEGAISSAFKTMLNGVTSFVEMLTSANRSMADIAGDTEQGNFLRALKDETRLLNDEAKIQNKTVEEIAKAYQGDYSDAVAKASEKVKEIKENIQKATEANEAMGGKSKALESQIESLNKQLVLEQGILGDKRGRLEAVNSVIDANTNAEKKNNEELERKIKKLKKLQAALFGTTIQERSKREGIVKEMEKALEGTPIDDSGNVVNLGISGLVTEDVEEMNRVLTKMAEKLEKVGEKGKIAGEDLKAVFQEATETFSDMFDIDISKFDFLFDDLENSLMDWASLSKELIGSVLDASLNRYEVELAEAQRARDLIVNNELATEKEKRLARQKFEEEERSIKTRAAKAEQKNALFKIAIDTAASIVKAFATVGPLLAPPLIPFIVGLGALQAGIVASQKIPKFKEGTKRPLSQDTLAITGDGGVSEYVTRKGKLLGVTPDQPTMTFLPEGAEVHKNRAAYFDSLGMDRAMWDANLYADGKVLKESVLDGILINELGKMNQSLDKTNQAINKLAKRPNVFKPSLELPYDLYE